MSEPSSCGDAFHTASKRHRAALEARGYAVERQVNLDNYLVRNSPWKTYWTGAHERHGPFFAKVNYGYSDALNRVMGEKEGGLPAYFADRFGRDGQVRFPEVLETWTSEGDSFVVFRNETMNKRSGFDILLDDGLKETFVGLLRRWEAVPPPAWWTGGHETHDFALNERYGNGSQALSPFGFDLDDNLAVGGRGNLLLYDFEFIQWSSRGLQSVYLAQKHATEFRKLLPELLRPEGTLALMLNGLKGTVGKRTVRQGFGVHCEKLRRNGEMDVRKRLLGFLVHALIRKRVAG